VVVYAYNPRTWEAEAEELKFVANSGYTAKSYLKKKF
jgi:hypothetical protein